VAYKTDSVPLAPGDFCFVCTDGVVDAKNPSGEFFTKANLIALLTRPFDSAEAMLDRIRRSLFSHIADADQFDDITMVMFHRNPSAEPSPDKDV
jgi:serine phosphatase RsbU (regulator of sigma subunit)